MAGGDWTWLEIAKLSVAAAVPIVVVGLTLAVNRAGKRVEDAQWASRKLIERRIELFDQMAEPLNDLLCFFRLVGHFRAVTPPEAIQRKRTLDKLFYVNRVLMSEEFAARYQDFIATCFSPYQSVAHDARLRASAENQREERGDDWRAEWEDLFVKQADDVASITEVSRRYDELMEVFAAEVGVFSGAAGRGAVPA